MATYRITIPISVEKCLNDGGVDGDKVISEVVELEVYANHPYDAAKKLEKVLSKLLDFGN
jgi:hypothetical protein